MNYEGPSGKQGTGASTTAAAAGGISVIEAQAGTTQVVPGGAWILKAQFVRQGSDLMLTGPDGQQVLLRDFFRLPDPPDLITEGGQLISAELAIKLAGPLAPGQYAQAAPAGAGDPIGKVTTVEGKVQATRADGTQVLLKEGDPVFQGDVLETGGDSAVGIEFADETTFSLGDNGRMTLDEMVYDPGGDNNSFGVSLVQGTFSFISGQIAKSDTDAMSVTTPVATIGIRGTKVAGNAAAEGSENSITLLDDGDDTISIDLLANDTDVDGDAITVTSATSSLGATIGLSSTPAAQVDTGTIAGTTGAAEAGDLYLIEVDGNTVEYVVTGSEADLAAVRDAVVNAINADTAGVGGTVLAAAGTADGEITLTAKVAGTAFETVVEGLDAFTASSTEDNSAEVETTTENTPGDAITYDITGLGSLEALAQGESLTDTITYTIADENAGADDNAASVSSSPAGSAAPQVDTFTFTDDITLFDEFSITVNGTPVSLIVADVGDVGIGTFMTAFVDAINNDSTVGPLVTAARVDSNGVAPTAITITSDTAGGSFTSSLSWERGPGETTPITAFTQATQAATAGAQVDTVTLAGTHGSGEAGDTYSVTIDGTTITYKVTGSESGLDGVRDALAQRNAEAQCGIYVIDTRTGDAVHWLKIEGIVEELYDVVAIPGARRPMAYGFKSDEIRRTLSVGEPGRL